MYKNTFFFVFINDNYLSYKFLCICNKYLSYVFFYLSITIIFLVFLSVNDKHLSLSFKVVRK